MNDRVDRNFIRIFMPYCIKKLESGKYVVLNRNYKPLGITTEDFVDYEPYGVELHGLTEEVAQLIDHEGRNGNNLMYLYGDASKPWQSTQNMNKYIDAIYYLAKITVGVSDED